MGYFVLLIIERYGGKAIAFLNKGIAGRIYTLFFVNLLWVFFRSGTMADAFGYIGGMFGSHNEIRVENIAIKYIPFVLLCIVFCLPFTKIRDKYKDSKGYYIATNLGLAVVVVLSICAITNTSYTPFIYGRF